MPRALIIEESRVDAAAREAFLSAARVRRRDAATRGCNHWLFEDRARPGTFFEFVEARDADTLARALPAGGASPPILSEVELT